MEPTSTPFTRHVLDELTPVLQTRDAAGDQALGERLGMVVRGEREPEGPIGSARQLTERQQLLGDLIYQFSDITEGVSAIRMAAVFAKQFPSRKTYDAHGITRSRYLRYHFEHAAQETYRVRESLKRTVRLVEKHLVQVSDDPERAKEICRMLKKWTLDNFDHMSKQRGRIVHEGRYQDYELERMDTLHLLYNSSDEKLEGLRIIHDDVYRTKRRSIAQAITDSGDNVEQRVEQVFKVLDALLFAKKSDRGSPVRD